MCGQAMGVWCMSGPGWIGLGWAGLGWAGLGRAGLGLGWNMNHTMSPR